MAEELARLGARVTSWYGPLALSPDPPVASIWAQNIWTAPVVHDVASIKSAANLLRSIQRNWGFCPVDFHGRANLIIEHLPTLRPKPLVFPCAAPTGHLGAWTLLAPDQMLASPTQTSAFINGEIRFEEDRVRPPSRAYLKFWEACTRLGFWPVPGETCLDLGASPGGWSWAIAKLGATVTAVDKARLDPTIAAMPGVTERLESAFGLDPRAEAPVDWLCSDVIAYPDRLLALVQNWIAAGKARRIVCTVKLQGATDHAAVDGFAQIRGGQLVHLFHNKHELTFLWVEESASF